VRASATSQAASVANHQVSQNKADANKADAKADESSPFALLLEVAAPKEAAKPSRKDADSGDKPADDKPVANQDDKAATAQVPVKPPAKTDKSDKSGKSDKSKNEAAAKSSGDATNDPTVDSQIAAADPQLPGPQVLPPAPPAPPIVATPTNGKSDDIPVGPTTAAAAPPAANSDLPIDAAASAATAPQAPMTQSDDSQAEESEPATSALTAQLDVKPSAPGKDNAKPVAAKAIAKPVADTSAANKPGTEAAESNPVTSDITKVTISDGDAAKSGLGKGGLAKEDFSKDDVVKTDAGEAAKGHVARSDVTATNADKVDASKTAELQANLSTLEADNIANAPKTAPQPVQSADTLLVNDRIAAPHAPLPSQANTQATTQHVQVSAHPNVPALAVEIAAKSQSGAKQFDIRLDPPELGRVEVRLSIDATGKASAHLSADRPETLTLLQKDAPVLTRALREAGLDVSQDGLNFSLRQQADGGNANNGGRRGSSRAFSLTATAAIDATATTASYRGRSDGRLDIRV
jgi:flagellar hook-length control protein FliK